MVLAVLLPDGATVTDDRLSVAPADRILLNLFIPSKKRGSTSFISVAILTGIFMGMTHTGGLRYDEQSG
jgi:hypothetical protein